MTDQADEDTRAPADSNVADYKVILRRVLDNRPSGTRLKLAAALCAEDFGAAFYSIGSNDLTQYTMAAARDIGAVADLNDAGHPAVLALIARTVEAARKRDVEVSLCGDAAADTRLTTALLATGLRTLSVAPLTVARLKAAIAKVGS